MSGVLRATNYTVDLPSTQRCSDAKKVSDLTVGELRDIIRDEINKSTPECLYLGTPQFEVESFPTWDFGYKEESIHED